MRVGSTTSYFLTADAYFCRIDDGAVFLHLGNNKYYSIASEGWKILERQVAGLTHDLPAVQDSGGERVSVVASTELLEGLVGVGLLSRSGQSGQRLEVPVCTAEASLPPTLRGARCAAVRPGQVLMFLRAACYVRANLARRRLKQLLMELRGRHVRAGDAIASGVATDSKVYLHELLTAFRLIRLWFYTAHDECLFDSLVLSFFLAGYGVRTTLVIGVATKPFGAHAWVQSGPLAVDDTVEKVRQFVPILAC